MQSPLPAFALCFALAAAGCSPFPELEGSISEGGRAAGYPALLPMEALAAPVSEGADARAALDGVAGRAAGLRTRAAALRGPVLDAATRRMLLQAVRRHP